MKTLLWAFVAVSAAATGATWYLTRRIHSSAFRAASGEERLDLEVVAVSEGSIRLRPSNRATGAALRQPGRYGLLFEGGYGQAWDMRPVSSRDNTVEAWFAPLTGAMPRPGTAARIDSFALAGDPRSAHGLEWEPVEVPTPLGPAPAWLVPADPSRCAIFVHGKGARREETLRMLPVVHATGWSSLVITYRNDPGCAGSGCYGYGATEWEDLEAAARFAIERGAQDILLVGYSMGAGIALSFLTRSPLASSVRALILDSPMTDLYTLLRLRGRALRIPEPVLAAATGRALRRAGLAGSDLDYHRSFTGTALPVLLFHGDSDAIIPVALSDAFAANRPNITYHRVPRAGHVRSWNTDPERYESAVGHFLEALSHGLPAPSGPRAAARGRQ